jgi:hypothetical protein
MNMLGLPSSVRIALKACYGKFLLLHYTQVLCQYRLCKADYAYLTYLMLQQQLSHLNGRKLDHIQVKASYIFQPFPTVPILLRVDSLQWEPVFFAVVT